MGLQGALLDAVTVLLPRVPLVVRSYWILASAAVVLAILPLPLVPRAFKAAVQLAAARGKLWHNRPNAAALGGLKDASVPQSFFEHFYLVGAIATTVLLQVYVVVYRPDEPATGVTAGRDALLALLMFELHVMRRYAETNYLMYYPEGARMHLLAYLFGLSYYVAVPLTLLPTWVLDVPVLRNVYELAVTQERDLAGIDARIAGTVTDPHPELPRIAAAVGLFVVASLMQLAAHVQLGRLARAGAQRALEKAAAHVPLAAAAARGGRRPGPADGGETEVLGVNADGSAYLPAVTDVYGVPSGGLFSLVCCPHYLSEILIYVSLAIATRGAQGALLVLAWVVVNLVLAALATKRWYREHFKEFPRRRAALVPFIL